MEVLKLFPKIKIQPSVCFHMDLVVRMDFKFSEDLLSKGKDKVEEKRKREKRISIRNKECAK